jgi:hypothetical protein
MRVALAMRLLRGDRVGDAVLKGPRHGAESSHPPHERRDLNGSAGG